MRPRFVLRLARDDAGYVLLAVLAALVLVTTVLGTLAEISLRRGLAAADAERQLQQRWGSETLRRAILPKAAQLFDRLEAAHAERRGPDRAPATYLDQVVLGGATFDLLLADEDAKLNLNTLYHMAGPSAVEQAIQDLLPAGGWGVIRLLPAVEPGQLSRSQRTLGRGEPSADESPPAAFRSWGEVFDLTNSIDPASGGFAVSPATTEITCWGSGALNLRRAADGAVVAALAPVVQDAAARRMLHRYRNSPAMTLAILLQTEVNRELDRQRLSRRLSETSTSFSLWIDASMNGSRSIGQFTVISRDADGGAEFVTFTP